MMNQPLINAMLYISKVEHISPHKLTEDYSSLPGETINTNSFNSRDFDKPDGLWVKLITYHEFK